MRKIQLLLALMVGLLPAYALAADAKIGYVNIPYLINNAPQAKAASEQLEQEFAPKQQELQRQKQELQRIQQKLQKDGLVMSEKERGKLEERGRELQREIKRKQSAFREELNVQRNSAFKEVRGLVMETVQSVAKNEGYDLVVGQGTLYASDAVNLTEQVLERMKERYQGEGSR